MSYELITTSKTKNRHINYRKLSDVLYGVVHWWGDDKGKSFDETVNFLCNNDRKVSANYVVEAGRVAQIADDQDVALHAGQWEVNEVSIGLENRPDCRSEDLDTLAQLIADIELRLGHSLYLIGHRDIISTSCPGEYYPHLPELIHRVNTIKAGMNNAPAALTAQERADRLAKLQELKQKKKQAA
ncbi:peptidoglycan recognition family protein [Rothia aeria]|jgi:hypothetical protein|uniref:peptidoglycan recognition protein family protein n=1 Tax=Rothia aeria TaxID=172042 RepID=UPI0028E37BAA|nr:peptidoglycan recognition family protein [Rothia aeria]